MTRRLAALLAVPLLLAADPAAGGLAYAPPTPPAAPDPAAVLFRLFGLTAAALLACGLVLWLLRRSKRPAAPTNGAGRLLHDGSLPLDRRCTLHLLRADGHAVAVTTDATGLRSLVVLSEPFDHLLAAAAARAS